MIPLLVHLGTQKIKHCPVNSDPQNFHDPQNQTVFAYIQIRMNIFNILGMLQFHSLHNFVVRRTRSW